MGKLISQVTENGWKSMEWILFFCFFFNFNSWEVNLSILYFLCHIDPYTKWRPIHQRHLKPTSKTSVILLKQVKEVRLCSSTRQTDLLAIGKFSINSINPLLFAVNKTQISGIKCYFNMNEVIWLSQCSLSVLIDGSLTLAIFLLYSTISNIINAGFVISGPI